MRIDAHAHVIVPEVLREPWGPRVRWEDAEVNELQRQIKRPSSLQASDLLGPCMRHSQN